MRLQSRLLYSLSCGIATLEAMFIPQPLKNTFGGMSLLTVSTEILRKPLINKASEAIQLGPLDICRLNFVPFSGQFAY